MWYVLPSLFSLPYLIYVKIAVKKCVIIASYLPTLYLCWSPDKLGSCYKGSLLFLLIYSLGIVDIV